MTDSFRSGFVSFVGRPNVGKSTLINALVGVKVAITSRTVQTTRRPLRAIANGADYQLIAVDTPGLHKPQDALGESLNRAALRSLEDADAVVMVFDATSPAGRGDRWIVESLTPYDCPCVAVINKIDRVDAEALAAERIAVAALRDWSGVYEVSAKTKAGLDELTSGLVALLPVGPAWFPQTMTSDAPLERTIEEIVREKLLRRFREEVPHALAVSLRSLTYDEAKDLWSIDAEIYAERPSQKAMVIGAKGSALKSVGTLARKDLEKLLGGRVYLHLNVEVKRHWRNDESSLMRFGYGDQQ